jgi:hypothetical protein
MELALGYKVPVAWHLGPNNYNPSEGVFHPGTIAVGPTDGGLVSAMNAFTQGRGAILIAQPTAGPWGAQIVDALETLSGGGGSSHFWMSPSICEDSNERWVLAMARTGEVLGYDLSFRTVNQPYHQEGATPGYGDGVYGDDGREPRFFQTENFAGKTAGLISMLLVELVQYISDNSLAGNASDAYPAFNRNLGGASTTTQLEANARRWCTKNSIAIINDYLTGCGSGATTTTTSAPTTTTTTSAPTTTTTTLAESCVCYTLTNPTQVHIFGFEYTNCEGLIGVTDILKNSSVRICVRSASDIPPHPTLQVSTSNVPCVRNAQNEFECCPLYDISYSTINRAFTIGCALVTDVVTLTVSRNGQPLILGQDYTIDYPAPNNCLIITAAATGTYTFVINGCTYTKVLS